jgi:hypothetical protein
MALRALHKVVVSDFDALGITAWKTGDETVTSSTVLQADDQLFLPLSTNARYKFESYLIYSGAATPAGDLKMQFTGPAGAVMNWSNFGANPSGLTQYNVVVEALAAGAPRAVGTNGAGFKMGAQPKGTLTTGSTGGSLALLWAQNASSATGTVLHANSYISLLRVS